MTKWFWFFGIIFIILLILASSRAIKKNRSIDDYMLAGSNIGAILGVLTYAAALFSAFIFIGVPDFFRVHGVGAWIFLPVSDGMMFFMIFWFGYNLRKKARETGYKGMAGMMRDIFGNKWAGYLVFTGAFLFLIPYVAIQIRGMSMFFTAIFPEMLPSWGWALIIVGIMLAYSELGGLKAIVFSDAVQGVLLLTVLSIIGYNCIIHFGNVKELFNQVQLVDDQLLSTPGPQGLFTTQFLVASFLAIILLPISQPQFSSRIVVMKSMSETYKMAGGVSVVALIVFIATAFIGMYGAVEYTSSPTVEFVQNALLFDQPDFLAGLAIVGLFAAVLSTSNAQIFALGSEFRSLLKGDDKSVLIRTKTALFIFAIIVMAFSVIISDELVLLARVSFAGTSMLTPVILIGVISKKTPGKELLIVSAIALFIFLFSVFQLIPENISGVRLDLGLYIILFVTTIISVIARGTLKQDS
jgi:SSS family solute:Na+ symporter